MTRNSRKSQHKRSPAQEAQTHWMHGSHHHCPSQDEVEAFRFVKPSSDVHGFQDRYSLFLLFLQSIDPSTNL
ncbi:hypothetical protein BDM02DRAFT_3119466 [Thelephora ganbajun]|uniref:Uncharacterized protein n=1 Tax=Thelephora ganbajun TaxID=370292 RepID=A0ACB6Z986_THEGA|nr:hypothetical protein BDM02DRAFT_3119466 [Thelephora ganbajun]